MTRCDGFIALLCFLCLAYGTTPSLGEEESKEPPLTYEVKLGDQLVTVNEGEAAEFSGTFINPKVSFTPLPHRVFPYQGITFKYPRSFGFKSNLVNPNAKSWDLSGTDLKIMVSVLLGHHTTDSFAEDMLDSFGRNESQITNANAEITLGAETLLGTTLQLTTVKTKMVIDIYQIPSRGPCTKFLLFQDILDDDGHPSKEARETLEVIKKSFELKQ